MLDEDPEVLFKNMKAHSHREAWLAQRPQTGLTIDADLLLKEVRRNQKAFTAMLSWRGLRGVW